MKTLLRTLVLVATTVVVFQAGQRDGVLAIGDAPVQINSGLIAGVVGIDPEVRVFKGIPFAAPPVGRYRWDAPRAVARWEGVRKAAEFSASCPQPTRTGAAALLPTSPRLTPSDEDCLYLNVWTAAKAQNARLPVMVYIPGGGFTAGGGSGLVFDGEALAQKGVVLVTVNYRLGVLGFFAHPELTRESGRSASGNYGLMDQTEALRWVQKNIAAFGGDPNRVTVFGQSAGASSAAYQMTSPQARGLFHRVIAESGGPSITPLPTLGIAEQTGVKLAESLGAKTLDDLRAKPWTELLKASSGTGVIVDGWFLAEQMETIFQKGRQTDVPLLVGSNSHEANVLLRASVLPAQAYVEQARTQYGRLFDSYMKLYPTGSDELAKESQFNAFNDTYAWRTRTWAGWQTSTGKSRAYLYYFTRQSPADGPFTGAAHGAELYYVFRNLRPFKQSWSDWDRQLEDIISSYWVNFATNADPNGGRLPQWTAYRNDQNNGVMILGDRVRMGTSRLDNAKLALLQQYHEIAMAR